MNTIEKIKLTKLTAEDIEKLNIHSTRSSIRRAADSKLMITVPGTEDIPTLYYIREFDERTEEEFYSIHALSTELTKFLLLNQIKESSSDSESEEEGDSTDQGDSTDEGNSDGNDDGNEPIEDPDAGSDPDSGPVGD